LKKFISTYLHFCPSPGFPAYYQNLTTEDTEKLSDFRELKKLFFPLLCVLYITHLIPSFLVSLAIIIIKKAMNAPNLSTSITK
jgi:hypothetical protein